MFLLTPCLSCFPLVCSLWLTSASEANRFCTPCGLRLPLFCCFDPAGERGGALCPAGSGVRGGRAACTEFAQRTAAGAACCTRLRRLRVIIQYMIFQTPGELLQVFLLVWDDVPKTNRQGCPCSRSGVSGSSHPRTVI